MGNQSPFTKKSLSKAIMVRSEHGNSFLMSKTDETRNNYSNQENFFITPFQKGNREYFGNLDEKSLCDNKKFWSVEKPL